jgi:hypothetical protein
MKTLEEEAAEWARRNIQWSDGFIAGANSKWVQAEKIKAQIEVLKLTHLRLSVEGIDKVDDTMVFTINELEKQLKQLEE